MERAKGRERAKAKSETTLDDRYVEDAIKFFGWIKAFHVIGFCRLWLVLDRRPIKDIVAQFEERGLCKSTVYGLLRDLQRWVAHIEEREGLKAGSLSPEIVAERVSRATAFR